MAINPSSMLMQVQPLSPLGSLGGPGKDLSMERKRLQLMREQFEETKRVNARDEELRRIEEAGRLKREQMQTERQEQHDAALAAAELLTKKRAAHEAFLKHRETGDYEGMEATASVLNELGAHVERLGEDENGLPTWQVDLDGDRYRQEQAAQEEQAAPRGESVPAGAYGSMEEGMSAPSQAESLPQSLDRLNALGYDTSNPRGSLDSPGTDSSSPEFQERFQATIAQRAQPDAAAVGGDPTTEETDALSQYQPGPDLEGPPAPGQEMAPTLAPPPGLVPGGTDFKALRGPDAPDLMGAVPKNVIDTGAMNAQANKRLGPAMAAIEQSYPAAYRDMAKNANAAVAGLGLPADKALALAAQTRGQAGQAVASELDADRDLAKEERAAAAALAKEQAGKELSPKDEAALVDYGHKDGWKSYTAKKMDSSLTALHTVGEVERLLTNDDATDDDLVVNLLMEMNEQVGAQSDKDAARVTGLDRASFKTKVTNWIHEAVEGGFSDEVKAPMIDFIESVRERNRAKVFDWMKSTYATADAARHPLTGEGYRDVVRTLPQWLRDEYEEANPSKQIRAPGVAPANGQPESAIDPLGADGTDITIPEASRIAFVHNNAGNLMFNGQPGAEQGEPKKGGGHWAKFPSVEAGLRALQAQLEKDAAAGLSLREFVTKYAPPTDGNDTEGYIKEMLTELRAHEGDLLSDVDLYDALRFVAKKESSTVLPAQYKKPMKGSTDAEEAYPSEPPPTFEEEAAAGKAGQSRAEQLLQKAGH